MSSTPKKERRKRPPRPRIKIPLPGQFPVHFSQTPVGTFVSTPYAPPGTPNTANSTGTGQPTTILYTNKASEFLQHLKGFKNWTKSGLSVGEKSAFWLYDKVGSWSKRWFTHIFLFIILFLYSILGAFLFIQVEGEHESNILEDIKKESMYKFWFFESITGLGEQEYMSLESCRAPSFFENVYILPKVLGLR
ncbi:hypothetical protein QAD02_022684 [Eretmocerus hayati]|uniref:Uncharacterized protein n=1 Tax=Eretmocerus hayati TaxID=131215 RepID=A0ACC2PTG6_9HYME|nr:hypothetical protein QAD02_022684 [Eretmocerus hayati]